MNYFLNDYVLIRSYYRYYWDSWGISAHTASLEVPIKITRFFSVYPLYRYHTQTAADYFAPFKEHSIDQAFYTSDYDLAGLNSHHYGAGARFSPVSGLGRVRMPGKRKKILLWKGIDIRYGHYTRSDGLVADIISGGLNFSY